MTDLKMITWRAFSDWAQEKKEPTGITIHPKDSDPPRVWRGQVSADALALFLADKFWESCESVWREWAAGCFVLGSNDAEARATAEILQTSTDASRLKNLLTSISHDSALPRDIREMQRTCVRLVLGVVTNNPDARLTPRFLLWTASEVGYRNAARDLLLRSIEKL